MWFHIDPSSGTPIYLQIVEQVRQAAAGGVLRPGQRLPATRDLAVELAVNPNTIVKAYQTLEREGVIEVPRGRGAFLAAQAKAQPRERLSLLRPAVDRLAAEAWRLACTEEEVVTLVRKILREMKAKRSLKQQGERDDD